MRDDHPATMTVNGDRAGAVETIREAFEFIEDFATPGDRIEIQISSDED
jgi:hypothetical protein